MSLRYDEAPALPGVPAPFRRAGLYLDRVGTRRELAGGEAQAAGGSAVLKRPYRLPVEVHKYVVLGQGDGAVRYGGLYRGPRAADVPDGAHRGYGDSPPT